MSIDSFRLAAYDHFRALNEWAQNPNSKPSRRDLLSATTGAIAAGGITAAALKSKEETKPQTANTTDNLIAVIEEKSKSNDPKDKIVAIKSLLALIPQIKTETATLAQLAQVIPSLDLDKILRTDQVIFKSGMGLDRAFTSDQILTIDKNLASLINQGEFSTTLAVILNIVKQTDASVEERAQAVLALPSIVDLSKLKVDVKAEQPKADTIGLTPNAQARRIAVREQLGLLS